MEVGIDITERRKAEKWLMRSNRALRTISACNQVQIHSTSEEELLKNVCKVIVEEGGYKMAWVGYAEQDDDKTVKPVSSYGFEQGYLESINITWADTERGQGPTGTAIRTGKPSSCRNMLDDSNFAPWREEAIRNGYSSSLVIPLILDGKTFGAISIYSVEPNAFDSEEVNLLNELADDLTFGILAIRDRIERQRAEEKLRSVSQYTRSLIEASLAPLVTISKEGIITDVNEATEKSTGLVREKLIGTDFSDYFAEPEKAREGYQKVLNEGIVLDYPLTILHKSGKTIDVLYNATIYKNSKGEIEGVFAAARDITEMKKAEEKAKEAFKLYRVLFENMEDGLLLTAPDGRIFDANPAATRILGFSREEIINIGRSGVIDITDPKLQPFVERRKNVGYASDELTLLCKDGSKKPGDISSRIFYNEKGEAFTSLIFRDITERKRTEKELIHLASFPKMNPNPILEINHSNQITFINTVLTNLINELDLKDAEFFIPDNIDEIKGMLKEDYAKTIQKEVIINNRYFEQIICSAPGLETIRIYGREITEYRHAELKIKESEAGLKEAQRLAKIGNWSWELQTGELKWSDELYNITGRDKNKKPPSFEETRNYYTPESLNIRNEAVKKSMELGVNTTYDSEMIRVDNQKHIWVQTIIKVEKDDSGKVTKLFGTAQDITERKEAERRANESYLLYRLIFENSEDGVILSSPDGRIHDTNPAATRILGFSREEFLKIGREGIVDPSEVNFKKLLEKRAFNGYASGELTLISKNGGKILTDISTRIFHNEKGETFTNIIFRDITERKNAEKLIRESEEQYRMLIDNSPFCIHQLNLKGELISMNDAGLKMMCVENESDIKGMPYIDAVAKVDKERIGNLLEKALFGESSEFEFTAVNDNIFLSSFVPIKDADGTVMRIMGITQDITERKEADEKLKTLNDEILDLYNNAPCGYHSIDEHGFFTRINDTELKWLGFKKEELVGKKNFVDLLTPSSKTKFNKYFPEFKKNGFIYDLEMELKRKNGSTFFVNVNATAVYDEAGNYKYSRSSMFDITSRKIAEEKLSQAETNWKETFNAISDQICLLESDGSIIQCNESMLKNIGATEDTIKGRKCFELMHGTKTFLDDCPYSKMMKSKKREINELKMDGKYFSVSVDPIVDANGKISGAVHIIRDITDRKIAEEQMRELAHHIQVIREEERTTLSRTLHDSFGQSLTGMKMEISAIEKKLSKLIDLTNNTGVTEKIKSMKSMIDELAMVTSKMSMELRPNVLDMLGLLPAIEWVVEDFKSKSGINCKLNSKLDKIDIVSEHSTEVFRIIQEALTNIVRHADASFVNINILRENDNIIVEIIDDGKGIKNSDISSPLAFGLLGMNERSSLFGGKIEISGETDKGTKLILYIPERKNAEFKIRNDKNN